MVNIRCLVCAFCGRPLNGAPQKVRHFMRHGRTKMNEESICVGSIDDPLSEFGCIQAHQAAVRFGRDGLSVKLIVTSPLVRARETARIVSEVLSIPVSVESRLRERNAGEIQGKPETPESDAQLLRYDFLPKGAEPLEQFEAETNLFLAQCLDDTFPPSTLFVTHGFWLLIIVKLIHRWDVNQIMAYVPPGNCELLTFSVAPPCQCGNRWYEDPVA